MIVFFMTKFGLATSECECGCGLTDFRRNMYIDPVTGKRLIPGHENYGKDPSYMTKIIPEKGAEKQYEA